jgi:hypothetical protein
MHETESPAPPPPLPHSVSPWTSENKDEFIFVEDAFYEASCRESLEDVPHGAAL